jgi:SAM-dependent methyltransferase
MKLLIKRIFLKLSNIVFKIIYGISYSTYKGALTNRSFDSMSAILLWMVHSVIKKYPKFVLNNKIVAEIGSGQFLSHPLGLKLLGSDAIVSFDLYRQYNQKAAKISYSQQVMAKKIFSSYVDSSVYNKTMEEIRDTEFNLNQLENLGIKYKAPFDLNNFNEHDFFDFVISYTVLEHVPPSDISSLLEKSIKILKPGGHFCHFIDLEDHKDAENKPFEFLKHKEWKEEECFSRGNRLRPDAWKAIFDTLDEIEYEFISILVRNKDFLPCEIKRELNNYTSGILVVGLKRVN